MDAEELRRRREALGLNQTELAARLGLPRNTVWRWESGKFRIVWPVMLERAIRGIECDQDRGGSDD
jgi:transcriptional regulator with XRE-family HTH domain